MGDFYRFLQGVLDAADGPATTGQERALNGIAEEMQRRVRQRDARIELASERDLDEVVRHATTLDAIDFIECEVRERPRCVFDFPLRSRDVHAFLRSFDFGEFPRATNFAYVAWSERSRGSSRVKYVGKATSA